jgi:hypothetical protein
MLDLKLLARLRAGAHEGKRQMKARLRHMREERKEQLVELELLLEEFIEQGVDIHSPEGWAIVLAYLETVGKSPEQEYGKELCF